MFVLDEEDTATDEALRTWDALGTNVAEGASARTSRGLGSTPTATTTTVTTVFFCFFLILWWMGKNKA